jgi:hypothetical protein
MKRFEWQIGDLVNISYTNNLGVILKIHKKAGFDRFYLVHDNVTKKENWIHEDNIGVASGFGSNVVLHHGKERV